MKLRPLRPLFWPCNWIVCLCASVNIKLVFMALKNALASQQFPTKKFNLMHFRVLSLCLSSSLFFLFLSFVFIAARRIKGYRHLKGQTTSIKKNSVQPLYGIIYWRSVYGAKVRAEPRNWNNDRRLEQVHPTKNTTALFNYFIYIFCSFSFSYLNFFILFYFVGVCD